MKEKMPTPRRMHPRGVRSVALVKPDYRSIAQIEHERARHENFEKGSRLAALLLCSMFAFLSVGCVVFGW